MTLTDDEILGYDFFADDKDCDGVRHHTARIVTTRKEHECMFSAERHSIPSGSRARLDEAICDDKWCRFYSCIPCHEKWAKEWD